MAYTQPPTKSDGNAITAADHNTYTRDNFIEVEARKETQSVEVTADVTVSATSAATANTVITAGAFTPSGTDVYLIEFEAGDVDVPANAAGNHIIFHLYDGATNLGRLGRLGTSTANVGVQAPFCRNHRLTPTNASHTYSVRAHRTNANCTVNAGSGTADLDFPVRLRVTRLP